MADRVGREAGDLLAAEPDGARRARERPRDAVEGRGLSRAVRPDEPEDLAVPDPEGDRAQRREAAEALRQPANRENYRAANRSEEHTSELQSHHDLVCRLLLEKKKHVLLHFAA